MLSGLRAVRVLVGENRLTLRSKGLGLLVSLQVEGLWFRVVLQIHGFSVESLLNAK